MNGRFKSELIRTAGVEPRAGRNVVDSPTLLRFDTESPPNARHGFRVRAKGSQATAVVDTKAELAANA
jgi:hypothetical protein